MKVYNRDITCFVIELICLILARGQNVSGGFAQSIALARIFVRHDTKILILDEGIYLYAYILLLMFNTAMSQMDA